MVLVQAAKAAGVSVRVLTFTRVKKDARPRTALTSTPLTLHMRDIQLMLSHCMHDRAPDASAPRVVLASHGEGAWGSIAAALAQVQARGQTQGQHGMNEGDRGSVKGSSAQRNPGAVAIDACVCVAPVLMHRGRHMAWWDAACEASRYSYESDPERLEKLLRAPSVELDAKLLHEIDEVAPRRRETLKLAQRVIGGAAGGSAAARLAEDLRRERARSTVLSESERELLCALADLPPAALPQVRTITYDIEALPRTLPMEQRYTTAAWWLMASNAAGAYMAPRATRAALEAARTDAMPDIVSELSGGILQPAATRETAPQEGTVRTASGHVLAGVVAGVPESVESAYLQHAVRRMPYVLGLRALEPLHNTFTYLFLQSEMGRLPPQFSTLLVNRPTALPSTLYADAVARNAASTVVSIPLQAPDVIASELLDMCQNAGVERPRKFERKAFQG